MGNRLPKHVVVGIGVGVHMNHGDRAVLGGNGTQYGQGDGVVASQGDWLDVVLQKLVVMVFDDRDRLRQVECIQRDIANVGHLKRVEGRGLRVHPIGTSHDGFGTDRSRAETGAGAQAGANIKRNTEYGNVQTGCGGL